MLVPFIPPNRMRQRAGCLNNGREKNLLESTATAFHASWFLKKKNLNTTKIGEKSEAPNHTENPTRMHTENTSLARYFEAYPALQDDLELTSIC